MNFIIFHKRCPILSTFLGISTKTAHKFIQTSPLFVDIGEAPDLWFLHSQ